MKSKVTLYLTQSALWSFKTRWGLHLMSIMTMTLVFFLLGSSMLFLSHMKKSMQTSSFDLHISIYLDRELDSNQQEHFVQTHCRKAEIESCHYLSAKQAKDLFLQDNQQFDAMLNVLKKNPFPPSFEIILKRELKSSGSLESLVGQIKKEPYVEDVDDGGVWLKRWIELFAFIHRILFAVSLLFLAAMIFVIATTVQLVIHARRDELEIQKLIGATKNMLRYPFMLEGVIEGALAGGAALSLLWMAQYKVNLEISSSWAGLLGSHVSFFSLTEQMTFVGVGILVGLVGSLLGIEKYIRS
ncbi:MAG: permease-like cell division protein FtsX [Bdellovibrionota bacterium]